MKRAIPYIAFLYTFAHKQLANITMNQKSIEHIALYSLVLVGTLVVGVLIVSLFYPEVLTISVILSHFLQQKLS